MMKRLHVRSKRHGVPEEAGVPHVELSLEPAGRVRLPIEAPLLRWGLVVSDAHESCLVIDAEATIVALSVSCHQLLGLRDSAVGRGVLDGVLRLLDFTPAAGALTDGEVGKIPPLLALSSGRLARGLMRVRGAQHACTLDAIATPIFDGSSIVGSLTFFSTV
jgi:hypothetical protein